MDDILGGRIAEEGTHEELFAKENGMYKNLFEKQANTKASSVLNVYPGTPSGRARSNTNRSVKSLLPCMDDS